jgi:hypothetical protein
VRRPQHECEGWPVTRLHIQNLSASHDDSDVASVRSQRAIEAVTATITE